MALGGTREPAVAGTFYPAEPEALRAIVDRCLAEPSADVGPDVGRSAEGEPAPKALIVPHAGYVYSGPIAGTAYAALRPIRARIRRVVLLGPSHRVPVRGLATSSAAFFRTPLGPVRLDRDAVTRLEALPQVCLLDAAHALEHSLEVQLPFLQRTLDDFALVPLSVGEAGDDEVAEVLETLWDGPETLIVISSDLSHYYDYATARRLDAETTRAIEALAPERLEFESACGRVGVRGLLVAARRHGLRADTLDLRSSGDTAGPRDQVVGYGAWAFRPAAGCDGSELR